MEPEIEYNEQYAEFYNGIVLGIGKFTITEHHQEVRLYLPFVCFVWVKKMLPPDAPELEDFGI